MGVERRNVRGPAVMAALVALAALAALAALGACGPLAGARAGGPGRTGGLAVRVTAAYLENGAEWARGVAPVVATRALAEAEVQLWRGPVHADTEASAPVATARGEGGPGWYRFADVGPGVYVLRVKQVGWAYREGWVRVGAGRADTVDVRTEPLGCDLDCPYAAPEPPRLRCGRRTIS